MDSIRERLDLSRWRWMPATMVGLTAVTLVARVAGPWALFLLVSAWVVPLLLGYEMTRPVLSSVAADRTAAGVTWFLGLLPLVVVATVVVSAAILPGSEGVSIGMDSGAAWTYLPWFFVVPPAAVLPWAVWQVLRARGRPRERWVFVAYPGALFLLVVALNALNAMWTGQRVLWVESLPLVGVLAGASLLLHAFVRILWPSRPRQRPRAPPTLPDLAT